MFLQFWSISSVLFSLLFATSYGIQCQKTLDTDKNALDKCTGDFCVTNIVTTTAAGPAVPMITYGCLTGFDMKLGCFMDSWNNTVCVCNDADMCNANLSKNDGKASKVEMECHSGVVKDGKLVGNEKCKGQMCLLSYADTVTGMPAEIRAGCVYDMIPSYYTGKGCLLFPNVQGGNDTWQCRCQENLCNSPSSFVFPTRSGSVKCGSGFVNANKSQPGPFQNTASTCTGDFCLLTPMGEPPVVYSKGCISVSNGAHITNKRYKFDVGKSTDIYVCNQENCNEDVDTAMKFIGGTSINGNQISNTSIEQIPAATQTIENGTAATNGNESSGIAATTSANLSAVEISTVAASDNESATTMGMDHMHMHGMDHMDHMNMNMSMPMNTNESSPAIDLDQNATTLATTIISKNETVLATTVVTVNESVVVVPPLGNQPDNNTFGLGNQTDNGTSVPGSQSDNTTAVMVPMDTTHENAGNQTDNGTSVSGSQSGNTTAGTENAENGTVSDNPKPTAAKLHDTNTTPLKVAATTPKGAGSTWSISTFLIVSLTVIVLKL